MSGFDAVRRPGAASAAPGTALRCLAALALAANIAIHVYLAPDHIAEIPYIGAGFVAASMLLGGVLVGLLLWPADRSTWLAGAVLSAGMAALFVVSRTLGLPDYHEAWTSDSALGLWCLAPEAVFVVCAIEALARRTAPERALRR
ncbi:MAG TPA: hypothetical protein VE442_21685 [Jatrophihabitans sp.]|jgi:peptidoglycan/LPS O-acetylase OafA/YrhL|nr:hypothetical protein [Jatrophihabitans sp.]